jgi:hypothetical protein
MALPASLGKQVSKLVDFAISSSPLTYKFPKSSMQAPDEAIWRGVRDTSQFSTDDVGNLILNPGTNFQGKTTGVSFTTRPDVAWGYARRSPETPVPNPEGIVFKVNRRFFDDPDADLFSPRSRLRDEDMEGELAYYTSSPVVVPKGQWEVVLPEPKVQKYIDEVKEKVANKINSYYQMNDDVLVKKLSDNLSKVELDEWSGGIDITTGIDMMEQEHLQAKASSAIEQIIFNRFGPQADREKLFIIHALRAKIEDHPNPGVYVRRLNAIADRTGITGLYGPGWFSDWVQ